jgi:hypothetical protein
MCVNKTFIKSLSLWENKYVLSNAKYSARGYGYKDKKDHGSHCLVVYNLAEKIYKGNNKA